MVTAQVQLPVDFESTTLNYDFEGFEGAASQIIDNPDMTGENTSMRVMETEKTMGSAFFAGTTVTLDTPIDFSTDKGISIQTWSPKADIPVRIKLENADASIIAEVDVNTTVASEWETLTYDFSTAPAADYVKVIVFFEFIVDLAGDGTVYYYDNIQTADVSTGGALVGLPVDFESTELTYVFEGFEGADSNIETNPDQTGGNTSATVMRTTKNDGQWFAGTFLDLDTPIDFSTNKGIAISSWSPKVDIPVRIQIEDRTEPGNTRFVDVNTTAMSSWETLVADFTGVEVPGATYDRVTVIFEAIDGLAGDGTTYYYDNIEVSAIMPPMNPVVMPLTFEDADVDYNPEGFEGAASQVIDNPDMSGANTSMRVVETVKTEGAQFFAGTTIELDEPIDFSTDKGISIQTWSPKADIPVRIKIENADASAFAEVDVNTTVTNEWETLTFNFTNAAPADYTKVIVFFEFIDGLAGDGSTYYYDNVAVGPADPVMNPVVLPITFEDSEVNYDPIGFEGAASTIITNPDMSGVNTSMTVLETVKTEGAQFFAGTTIELDEPIAFTAEKQLFIDTWSPKAEIPVRIKIEAADPNVFVEVDVNTTVTSEWETLVFDFSAADDNAEYVKVIVFFEFIVDLPGDGSTYYYDNIAVSPISSTREVSTIPLEAFPNPTTDRITINAPVRMDRLVVYNLNGQVVADHIPATNQFDLDLGQLPTGTYTAVATTAEGLMLVRIAKQQ